MAHIEQHCTTLHNILLPNQSDSIMPRVLKPGGLSRTMCVCYTTHRKLGLLASAKRIIRGSGGSIPPPLFFILAGKSNSRSEEREEKTTKKQTDHGLTTPPFPPAPIK